MAIERKDNIGDTSATTGTGTLTLAAVAQAGARIFAGNVTSGSTVRYDIRLADGSEWEVGEGVFTDGSPDTLTRVTVYASSNSGSLVNFSAGTKNVSLVFVVQDIIDIMSALNPVGTIREFNVSTNPSTLLGFGTWSAFGAGRVTVCINAGDAEFDTNGETGGAKTHLLTGAESGTSVHSHGITDPGHIHTIGTQSGDQDGSSSNGSINGTSNTSSSTTGITVNNSSAGNASSAHNNLQPYIVVYRWVRTA